MERPTICVPAQYHSNRVLEQGDVLITEIGAQYMMGYPGQILRPFAIGAPPTPVYKVVYLALQNIMKKWTMPIHNWEAALNYFSIAFAERFPQ